MANYCRAGIKSLRGTSCQTYWFQLLMPCDANLTYWLGSLGWRYREPLGRGGVDTYGWWCGGYNGLEVEGCWLLSTGIPPVLQDLFTSLAVFWRSQVSPIPWPNPAICSISQLPSLQRTASNSCPCKLGSGPGFDTPAFFLRILLRWWSDLRACWTQIILSATTHPYSDQESTCYFNRRRVSLNFSLY